MKKIYDHRRIIFFVLLLVAGLLLAACGKKSTEAIDDSAALRSKPRAGEVGTPDPNVIAQGNALWQGDSYKSTSQQALALVNQERANAGLAALSWSDDLAACSMIRASELPSKFSHQRPDGSEWYTVCPELMWGENLADGYSTPEQVVKAWMDSPTHKKNLLNSEFQTCGIGLYTSGGRNYWGQSFGYFN